MNDLLQTLTNFKDGVIETTRTDWQIGEDGIYNV